MLLSILILGKQESYRYISVVFVIQYSVAEPFPKENLNGRMTHGLAYYLKLLFYMYFKKVN